MGEGVRGIELQCVLERLDSRPEVARPSVHDSQCHNSVSPSASIDLSSYDGIVAAVNTGRLLGAINQESGYSPMPKNSDKLSACFISQISIWINNGMPNN